MTAALLLAVVFVAFGLAASALAQDQTSAAPLPFQSTALTFTNWLLGI